ncbi:MAG TPA: hypothetical protein VLF95_09295 [Vicinamibacteria bacterium]|nr:hypothetical protein [Vicinamibacteria bacterium]
MRRRSRTVGRRAAALGCAAALVSSGVASAAPASRAWVLDTASRALVAVELPSGKQLGSLALPGRPWALAQGPDGSRLVVLDRGPGEDKRERGYKATGRSSATIVDATSLREVGRVELGYGIGRWAFSPDGGRLFVLCPGYEARSPAEALGEELVTVDLAAARETGRLGLEAGAMPLVEGATGRMVTSPDGRSLALLQGLPRSEKFPYPQARLWVVDPTDPSIRAKVDMGTWEGQHADSGHLYLLDPGKNRNGSIEVASIERGAVVGRLDAGRRPRGLVPDEAGGQVFVLADGPPGAVDGELRVVRGGALVATLGVAANPKLVVRERDVVYVVGEKAVTLVDPVGLQVTARIPLAQGGEALVEGDDLPTELKISSDGKRAFILYGVHNKVAVLDLGAKMAVGSTKTGRGGKKLFGNLMGGMFGMVGMLAAGYSYWSYTAPSMLAIRPDGRYAYAINSQTKDVTVVDGTTGRSVEAIGGGGYSLEVLEGGRFLVEVSGSELRLFDLERNVKAAEVPLPDLRGLFLSPDRSVAVALAKQVVLVLDGSTGKELARLAGFVSPDAIVFERDAGREAKGE